MTEFFPNGWSFDCYDENLGMVVPNSSFEGFAMPTAPAADFGHSLNEVYCPFGDGLPIPEINSSYKKQESPPLIPTPEDYPMSMMEDEETGLLGDNLHNLERSSSCKVEPVQATEIPVMNMGLCLDRKNRVKKLEGQPSKNLMAERRRRKRLNDRLSMLRSVVPKISKVSIVLTDQSRYQQMDRTSILGDTIDYMKELLERIKNLEEEIEVGSNQLNLMGIFKELKPNEILVRNSPKVFFCTIHKEHLIKPVSISPDACTECPASTPLQFEVERRNMDTRIEICCAGKPGLLLSTVTTLDALGLEIQQCVISCFNDFAMQASCSEELEQRTLISSEDIKQALFRNAGYGGRCL
ncbi:hypothetical protein HHK36_030803 [Tetracentron sinense]|uniref:BHLH domain-containing protein n=1 Tax=Tetracentron sinense TaxID=13715 RepID=A0A835D121_TETSI|nr:hypothetical protein HHK36_030803 [Tetracentron sinense]